MANKYLQQFLYSGVRMLTLVDCKITIGASGAVSSFSGNLIQSVVRDSIGHYTINLKPGCNMNATIAFLAGQVSGADGVASGVASIQKSPSSNISSLTAPTIIVQTFDVANALVNPASGTILEIAQLCRNSSVST